MPEKIDRQQAVKEAVKAWNGAPMHIRAMAGAYVGPILSALEAMGREIDELKQSKGASHG